MTSSDQKQRLARRQSERQVTKRRRKLRRQAGLISIPVALAALVVGIEVGTPGSGESTSTDGQSPVETLRAETEQRKREDEGINRVLGYTSFINEGGGRKRQVALTFDDGPGEFTPRVLRILKRTGTPATFFVVGSMISGRERTIKRIEREGHAIGNHTQDHPPMGELMAADQMAQLSAQAQLLEAAGGSTQRLFRPPYRSFSSSTLGLLAERGLLMVLWSVDTGDYEGLGSRDVARRALDDVKPGSIILMHDAGGDRSDTVRALPDIIRGLKRRKLTPVTVPRLVLDDPPPRDQSLPEGLSGG